MSEPGKNGPDRSDGDGNSRRAAIVGLIVVLLLVVAGYFLVTALRHESNLEDCLLAGRHNCAPIDVPARK